MKTITVFGSSLPKPGDADYINAETVGRALGAGGYAVMTGGYMGVMEAVSRGAAGAGAHVIGVTCAQIETFRRSRANAWVREEIKYPTLDGRLNHLVTRADGWVVMPGGVGTFNELLMAWELMRIREVSIRPLVCFGTFWSAVLSEFMTHDYVPAEHKGMVQFAHTPEQLIDLLRNGL